MTTRPVGLVLVLAVAGCSAAPSSGDRAARIDAIDRESRDLLAAARRMRARADLVEADYLRAAQMFGEATAAWGEASEQARSASADLSRAALQYQLTTMAVVLIALTAGAPGGPCEGHLSTAAYRRQLRAEGVPIAGRDVDHIFPRSLGGADTIENYQLLPSSVNRSLGAGVSEKFLTMPVALLRGIVASGLDAMLCGN